MYLFNKNIINKWQAKRVLCVIWKNISTIFTKTYTDCTDCNRTRGLERYYENKDKISNQQKLYYEKTEKKKLLQKQNNRWLQFEDLVKSYVELENRLKTIEEKFLINDSEIN